MPRGPARIPRRRRRRIDMPTFEPKPCAQCGNMYTPKTGNSVVCSPECVKARQKKLYHKKLGISGLGTSKCIVCKSDYQKRAANQNTCSERCRAVANRKQALKRHHAKQLTKCNKNGTHKWALSVDPWDSFDHHERGFVRDVELCPLR